MIADTKTSAILARKNETPELMHILYIIWSRADIQKNVPGSPDSETVITYF